MSQPMCSYCGAPCTPQQADESAQAMAVIEAARAYYRLWKPDRKSGGLLHEQFSVLMKAIEALEAAEKGDD